MSYSSLSISEIREYPLLAAYLTIRQLAPVYNFIQKLVFWLLVVTIAGVLRLIPIVLGSIDNLYTAG